MKTKKVVLFDPIEKHIGLPLALLHISRILDREGWEIKIVTENLYPDYVDRILEDCQEAVCFGVTCVTGERLHEAYRIASLVKERYPHLPIVWGGWHPSILPHQTIQDSNVDIVVRGQGEVTFTELVNHLWSHRSLKGVLGITYKNKGKIFTNSDRLPENINEFPPPPYHLVDVRKCMGVSELGLRTIRYSSSYGCPYRCAFCSEPLVNRKKWMGLDAWKVAEEIGYLVKTYGVDSIIFVDSNFFVSEERVKNICQEFIKRGLKIKWGQADGKTRQLLKYHPRTWDLMVKSGCRNILVGAESGLQRLLDLIQKDTTVEETIELARVCKRHGIEIIFSIMVGLPQELVNKDTLKEEYHHMLRLCGQILSISRKNKIQLFIYTPYPGTPLYERSISLGFKPPQRLEEWKNFSTIYANIPWVPLRYERLLNQLRYILSFLDTEHAFHYLSNVDNSVLRFLARSYTKINSLLANFRWRHGFFLFPLDYRLYCRLESYINKIEKIKE